MAPDGPEVVLDAVSAGVTTTSPPVADFRMAGSFLVEDAVAAVLSRVGFTVVALAVPMSPVAVRRSPAPSWPREGPSAARRRGARG